MVEKSKIENNNSSKKYLVFLLAKDDTDTSVWKQSFFGPYEYKEIPDHGSSNEWFDSLFDGYELWIRDTTLPDHIKMKADAVLKDIKADFASDGMKVKIRYMYHSNWLIVQVL